MPLYKNKVSQKIAVFAYDTSAGGPKTGNAAQITAEISKDGGASAATNDVNPTELDATDHPGVYLFDLTTAESNANLIVISPVSATSNIELEPLMIFTQPETREVNVIEFLGSSFTESSAGNVAANFEVLFDNGDSIGTLILDAIATASAVQTVDTVVDAIKAVTDLLPDAGALTTIGADTARLTAARAGALTDLIDGGRLDLLVDAIKAVTDLLPDAGALTTIGADTARLTAARAGALTDLIDGGRLDLLVDAIKAVTDALPDAGSLTTITAMLTAIGAYVDTEVAAIKVVTDKLADTLEDDAGTQRFTSNALEEAPSGSGTSPWSEAEKDQILAAVASADITVTSPLSADGTELEVNQGDDYLDADSRRIQWSSTGWPDLTGATVVFTAKRRATGDLDADGLDVDLASVGGATQIVGLELTTTETAALKPGSPSYDYDVQATLAGGGIVTLARGELSVLADRTE